MAATGDDAAKAAAPPPSPSIIPRMKLGSQGLEVSAQGLGCMGMSAFYGPPKPEADMIALIHHAVRRGVTFLDTSDIYGPFTNEILLGKAIRQGGLRDQVQLATKFGSRHFEDGTRKICGHPAYVRAACDASLQRLGLDCIDLYYQHRIDTRVPIEVTGLRHRLVGFLALGRPRARTGTHILPFLRRSRSFYPCEVQMGELKKLVEEGKIKYVGLSEASASTIRRAHTVHPITAIQLEWSLWSRDIEEEIIPTCRELGVGIVAYSPLGRGFLSSGPKMVEKLSEDDFRKFFPRFQPGNLEQNGWIFDHVNEMATRKGCTPSQLALAWVHHQGVDVCPIPGTTKVENLEQNIGALSVKLTPVEMSELESFATADSVKGDRYPSMEYTWMYSDTPPPPSRKTE